MDTSVEDLDILRACVEGDRRAWRRFVERFSRYVYYLVRLTGRRCGVELSEDEVGDLHGDVFLAFLEDDRRRLRQYTGRNGCSVRSWVRVIAIRRTIDQLRRQMRRRQHLSIDAAGEDDRPLLGRLADGGPDPLEALLEQAEAAKAARLASLAAALSEADRLLLELLFTQRLGAEAIAAALNIKRGAVYTRKTRLIKRLRSAAQAQGLL